ncbi:Dna2/Cas4 domain-containing protein [Candidatus Woesearchaeota archaeon]|nr:Dna2/Cas4 domain-containing protein [Candidatus Woesearchaeota archaeon]
MVNILFILIGIIVLSLILFLIFRKLSRKIKNDNKLPSGNIFRTDLNKPSKALVSDKYRLIGKPDYLLNVNGKIIPVEFKTSSNNKLKDGHVLQLASYCLLVEECFKQKVDYGILDYNGVKYEIPFNDDLKNELLKVLFEIRSVREKPLRNHENPGRCLNCSYNYGCPENLINNNMEDEVFIKKFDK